MSLLPLKVITAIHGTFRAPHTKDKTVSKEEMVQMKTLEKEFHAVLLRCGMNCNMNLSKNAIGSLINRYKAVLKKCHLLNTFGSLAVAGMLVMGGVGAAGAASVVIEDGTNVYDLVVGTPGDAETITTTNNVSAGDYTLNITGLVNSGTGAATFGAAGLVNTGVHIFLNGGDAAANTLTTGALSVLGNVGAPAEIKVVSLTIDGGLVYTAGTYTDNAGQPSTLPTVH